MTTPKPVLVWAEIPVRDIEAAKRFYATVFGYDITMAQDSPMPQAILGGDPNIPAAHLYEGAPASEGGPTLHLAVPGALEDSIKACENAGGSMTSEIIAIPPGRFAYANDPDGNKLGLFEPAQEG
ncbi:MAG TPA: VOC family protein [Aliiroseovarius sp.]|nr:VOC family protein [Aliiroseovarius sp.]